MPNKYLQVIESLSINKTNFEKYKTIIEIAISRVPQNHSAKVQIKSLITLIGTTERHHILPKSFKIGGEHDKENLVFLTPHEHLLAHKLLSDMFDSNFKYKMLSALAYFSNNKNKNTFSDEDIALIREANSTASKQRNKNNQYYKFRPLDTDHQKELKSIRAKNSKWINNSVHECFTTEHEVLVGQHGFNYGRLYSPSPERRQILSDNFKKYNSTKIYSDETKAKMSVSATKRTSSDVYKKSFTNTITKLKTCEYCEKSITIGNYARWHGPKCKNKSI